MKDTYHHHRRHPFKRVPEWSQGVPRASQSVPERPRASQSVPRAPQSVYVNYQDIITSDPLKFTGKQFSLPSGLLVRILLSGPHRKMSRPCCR